MISRDLRHAQNVGARHRWLNRLQTALLVLTLLGLVGVAGSLLLGDGGLWLALAAAGFTLLLEPAAASGLTLRLYGARPLHPDEAPDLWAVLRGTGGAGRAACRAGTALRAQRGRQRLRHRFEASRGHRADRRPAA
jgi:hypothetical protein